MIADPTALERPEALVRLRAARTARGITLAALAETVGKSPVFIGAVFAGQAMLAPETAAALCAALDVKPHEIAVLTEPPVRTCDPFTYRLHEMVDVYGEAIRTLTMEQFGDGILSAIDLKIGFERRGERALITLDAKFLPYKEF